jgi:hypothetical protein
MASTDNDFDRCQKGRKKVICNDLARAINLVAMLENRDPRLDSQI